MKGETSFKVSTSERCLMISVYS